MTYLSYREESLKEKDFEKKKERKKEGSGDADMEFSGIAYCHAIPLSLPLFVTLPLPYSKYSILISILKAVFIPKPSPMPNLYTVPSEQETVIAVYLEEILLESRKCISKGFFVIINNNLVEGDELGDHLLEYFDGSRLY